jgi:hypothetical protein
MPALRKRLFHALPAAMTELAQFGSTRGNLDQGAARPCNGALQKCYKHPWCAKAHAFSITLLPAFIGNLFENDRVAHCDDLMDLFAMQALAVGRQLAFFFRFAPTCLLVALARLPVQPPLALLPDTAPFIIVVRVTRSPLPIHFPLQSADRLRIGSQFLTKDREARFGPAGHQSDGGRPQIRSDDLASSGFWSTKRRPVSLRLFSMLERPRPRLLKRTGEPLPGRPD